MSISVFNARITPTSSGVISSDTFQVTASIYDGTGTYSGLDVGLNDVVFLDTFNSITSPGTISRYVISSLISINISSVTIVLKYVDTGTPVDPGEVVGNPGFIARASSMNGFAFHAAPTIHTFPDYITQYARDYDNFIKLDTVLAALGSTAVTGTYLNSSGSAISAFTLVKQDSSGTISTVNPAVESNVTNILGVLLQITSNGASGVVALSGLVQQITTAFNIGDVIYLSHTGVFTALVPDIGVGGFGAGDFVVKIGRITKNPTVNGSKDLKLEVQLVGQL